MDGPDTAGREHDEEEIWRDLVSRLDPGRQAEDQDATGDAPWPAEENLDARSFGARVVKPADPDAPPAESAPARPGEPVTAAAGGPAALDESDDHYIPPPPPPLPHLDAVTKGAWLALFGGPAYLLVATVAGWTISAWAAFCGVAAFIGGFVTLVVRMSDEDRDDSGPDNGAVV
ncbi:MAG TPA: hypothetical protein VKD26_15370 [Streptosporangiaceae bacterium]|nr:hypothetical protein [Streptosporangiaceae bacterium]